MEETSNGNGVAKGGRHGREEEEEVGSGDDDADAEGGESGGAKEEATDDGDNDNDNEKGIYYGKRKIMENCHQKVPVWYNSKKKIWNMAMENGTLE